MKRTLTVVLGILLVLAVAGGSFYGGMLYGKQQAEAALPARGAFGQGRAAEGTRQWTVQEGSFPQGGMLLGEIQEVGDGYVTVKDASGKSTQVRVTDTTLIQKQASVTLADLETGETVMVSGNQGEDGSITARSMQVVTGGAFGTPGGIQRGGLAVPEEIQPGGTNP